MLHLPDSETSFWKDQYDRPLYDPLLEDISVDVAIVGAGITGLTTAYLLAEAGLQVAVLEKRTIAAGTTGRTTGKVTSQHNLIYADLCERLGEKTARIYGEANQAALAQVEKIIAKENIHCNWQRDDNYVYTADPSQVKKFKKEAAVAAKLGLPATFETSTALPFEISAAVKFSNQGKLHSVQYLRGLADAVHRNGGYIFENSNVRRISDGSPAKVATHKAAVTAKHIVVTTNVPTLPLAARGGYCILEYPNESYIVAGRLTQSLKGMYISPDDAHYSILPIEIDGEPMLLVGGESHISGMRFNKDAKLKKLASYVDQHFSVQAIDHAWSDRDYLSYDGVPLVGKLYPWSRNIYVATAFMKWGLSNGTVAAIILRDQIVGAHNKWAPTFDSNRSTPIRSIPRVAAKYLLPG